MLYNNVTSVCIFVVDRDLLIEDTHRDDVKSTPHHVSGLVLLSSFPETLQKNHFSKILRDCCSLHAVTSSVIYYSTHGKMLSIC